LIWAHQFINHRVGTKNAIKFFRKEITMNESDKIRQKKDGLSPIATTKEWKMLYFQHGRPGLEEGSEVIGLCKYCELREICSIVKPKSGVWRCEYYKAKSRKKRSLYEAVIKQLEKDPGPDNERAHRSFSGQNG
jgi:hypothetical protein